MTHRKTPNGYFIVLEKGERVIESLAAFCVEEGVRAGVLSAIGAVEDVSIGYYDLAAKKYVWATPAGVFEVASMTGNVTLLDHAPFLHVHAVLSEAGALGAVIGAHVREMTVAVTLEASLTVFDEPIERALNERIGLSLCQL
jgi:predicted DNA-binding protein with PD1-like motif